MKLLKDLYVKAEDIKGTKLVKLLLLLFIIFSFLGFIINYSIEQILIKNELSDSNTLVQVDNYKNIDETKNYVQKEGYITFLDDFVYPNDEINFYLADPKGAEIILLKSNDQTLNVVEGFYVKVEGVLEKTKDKKKDVLLIKNVIVNNTESVKK